ncbi:MAG: hypothetical protein ACLPN5_19850 [Roseiarcus sp.]
MGSVAERSLLRFGRDAVFPLAPAAACRFPPKVPVLIVSVS